MLGGGKHAREQRGSRRITDLFGRRSSSMLLVDVPRKDYKIDVPQQISSDEEEGTIEDEIREYLQQKAEAERKSKTNTQINKRTATNGMTNSSLRPETSVSKTKATSKSKTKDTAKERHKPLNMISATLLLTDYDDQIGEDGMNIFKSSDYQNFGNVNDHLHDEKEQKNKKSKSSIDIDTMVFQVVIPGIANLKSCPHCNKGLSRGHVPSKMQAAQPSMAIPHFKEKSHILRRSSKPSALTTKRSNLADLMATPSNTKDSRSVSRSSIEKPGNYIKPGSRYTKPIALKLNHLVTNTSASMESASPIFKTMAEGSIHTEFADLSRSCIMKSVADKENSRGYATKLARVIPSFAKQADLASKSKGTTQPRNASKSSYGNKIKR